MNEVASPQALASLMSGRASRSVLYARCGAPEAALLVVSAMVPVLVAASLPYASVMMTPCLQIGYC